MSEAVRTAFATISRGSKSFALASRLLPPRTREEVAVVYTWCRRADDAVDTAASREEAEAALRGLRQELRALDARGPRAGEPAVSRDGADPVLLAFGDLLRAHAIPARWPEELLAGMEMDVAGQRYATTEELLLYCFRVAGTVGLMMSHVMGVSDPGALRNASHLGIAMQLTNIARDVVEDWALGRLYLPDDLLARHDLAGLAGRLGAPLPREAGPGLAASLRELLALADRYYRSGDAGLAALPWRAALSVRAARRIYAEIGRVVRRRGCDPFAGRAVVPLRRKLALAAASAARAVAEAPARLRRPFTPASLAEVPRDELVRL